MRALGKIIQSKSDSQVNASIIWWVVSDSNAQPAGKDLKEFKRTPNTLYR